MSGYPKPFLPAQTHSPVRPDKQAPIQNKITPVCEASQQEKPTKDKNLDEKLKEIIGLVNNFQNFEEFQQNDPGYVVSLISSVLEMAKKTEPSHSEVLKKLEEVQGYIELALETPGIAAYMFKQGQETLKSLQANASVVLRL